MKRDRSGFTLLEVVVAVSILAVSVGLAMQIFSGGLKNIYRIDLAHRAMNHAENVMNELLSDAAITGPLQVSGNLDDDFSYSATVDYWDPPEDGLSLDIIENQIQLLSVVVDIHFKNDRFQKRYRTVCLKSFPLDTGLGPAGGQVNPFEQLFGAQ